MLSFSKLGQYGRLGNQLFQYAFLRATARRLGTQFYCPRWDGDEIFTLADETERAPAPSGVQHFFDPAPEAGFAPAAMADADGTEIQGFFQSEKYYPDKSLVRQWYRFAGGIATAVHERYGALPLGTATSLSLRIDDDYANTREYFPLYPLSYYETALRRVNPQGPILVFADRHDRAKEFFRPLGRDLRFVDDLNGPQQLYLMSQCRANVITNSTFAWWGAWLNAHPDRVIVTPSAWCRPGVPIPVRDILCDDWIKIPGTRPIWDNFYLWKLRHPVGTAKRLWVRITDKRA